MNFPEFLENLFAEGRVAVPAPAEVTADQLRAAEPVLEAHDRLCRLELPEGTPPYEHAAAIWAATHFYRACQLAMFRDFGEAAITALAKSSLEHWNKPGVHYSVDLTFRFLPDLVRIAQSVAADDPLVNLLLGWCRRWPLSSVGVRNVGEVELGPIIESTALMQMYVDRILARDDVQRVSSEPVRQYVRRTIGLYADLSPVMAAAAHLEAEATK
jgi:hypothetical protein